MISQPEIARRIAAVQARIAERATRPARLVAVTKGFELDAVAAALASGVGDIGENYAAHLVDKAEAVAARPDEFDAAPRWHFIGHIQRNKVRKLAPHVALWHGVDRLSVADEIAKRAPGAKVLVQVATPGAAATAGRNGCEAGDVPLLVAQARDVGLDVIGLMAVGPSPAGFAAPRGWEEATRAAFRDVRALADQLELRETSMGMSADLDIALESGATMVRLGTALFGPRPDAPSKARPVDP